MFVYIIFAIGAVVGIVACIAIAASYQKDIKRIEEANETLRFHYSTASKSLDITYRTSDFSKLIISRRFKNTYLKDVPEKYVYTGATVGGVTTGGVSKVGGYTDGLDYDTDKYELLLKDVKTKINGKKVIQSHVIKTIYLNNELLEEAKNSEIECYIKGRNIVVVEEVELPSNLKYLSGTQAANMLKAYESEGYPTKEKCEAILEWLCKKASH